MVIAAVHKDTDKKQGTKSPTFFLMKRLLRGYVSPYLPSLIVAVFFMAFAGGMTAVIASLMQPILDDVLAGGKADLIIPISFSIALTFAARGITTYIHTILMNRVGHSIVADLQEHLFSHFVHLDLAFFS